MTATPHVDLSEFSAAIKQLSRGSRKAAVSLSNQIALDIVREWFNRVPPPIGQIDAKRREIRSYLQAQLSTRVRLAKSGKKFIKVGRKANQLRRVHLITQARQRKAGKKGLYGQRMRSAAAGLARRAQTGVGYLKAILLPVIRGLNPVVKYKMPYSETGGAGKIAIWPGSKGGGKVTPASGNPFAILNMRWSLHGPREGYARGLILSGWHQAVAFKLQKLKSRIEREMQGEFNRVNARRR